MFCDRCGAELAGTEQYCPRCGKTLGTVPPAAAAGRLARHVRLLGILWLAASGLRLLPALFLMQMHRYGFPHFPPEAGFVRGILRMASMAMLAGGIAGLIAGWGLLDRQPWARMLAIVLGAILLVDIPFGTALGIYTLWVLLPAESDAEYRRIAKA